MRTAVSIRGGIARGFGSLGFTRFLEEEGLEPDIVAGSSSGAMIASLYAAGISWQEVINKIQNLRFFRMVSPVSIVKNGSLISYPTYRKQFEQFGEELGLNPKMKIEELERKLVIFATDIKSRKKVAIDSGNLIEAILASSAYPGIFPSPIEHSGYKLYDGDLVPNYGKNILGKKYKISKVIGVSTRKPSHKSKLKQGFIPNLLETYKYLREQIINLYEDKENVEFELEYNADDQSSLDFKKIENVAQRTYRQARKNRKEIQTILRK